MWYFTYLLLLFSRELNFTILKEYYPDSYSGIDEVTCHCVAPSLCGDKNSATNGEGLIDVRYDNGKCANYFEICCENPIEDSSNDIPDDSVTKECGYQKHSFLSTRITSNSSHAEFGELPWTIIVLKKNFEMAERILYKCGGSLIHPKAVLTAAHCVTELEARYLIVRIGEWNTISNNEPLTHQDIEVEDIVVHPEFHRGSLRNDIALLFLSNDVELTDNIGLICLPPTNLALSNTRCIAGGWGKDGLKQGKHSTIMKKVELPLVDREKCSAILKTTRLGIFYNLHKSFICAGGERNKDTCKGDGGSPLVCPIPGQKDRYVQTGIVSWGIGCGESETPGVYVNVAMFSIWIDDEIQSRNLKSHFYKY